MSLAVAVVCALLVAAAASAVRAPGWLGVSLSPDASNRLRVERVAPGGPLAMALAKSGRDAAWLTGVGAISVTAVDKIEEPDVLPSYSEIAALLARQDRLAAAMDATTVQVDLLTATGTPFSVSVQPGSRPVGDLPALFWLQLFFGGGALFISGWLWSLRPRDFAVQMFALSGLGLAMGADAAAVYSSRELALDGGLFRLLSATNHLGGLIFGAAMVTVFTVYPRPLLSRRWPPAVMAAACLAFFVADTARIAPSPLVGAYLPILALSLGIVVLIAVQAWRNRRDPLASAALRWLGLSVIVGIGGFVAANAVPEAFGAPAVIPQAMTLGPFLLIYIGLALGLGRYRLFDLDQWAYRTLFYTVGALAVLAADAALLLVLQVERIAALGVALLLIGLVYLPLRDTIWRRLTARGRLSPDRLFGEVMQTVLTVGGEARRTGWRDLMQRLFEPLTIDTAAFSVDAPQLGEQGLEMIVPNVAPYPALALRFARGGRALFGADDLALARQAVQLMIQAEAGRQAYERGAAEERSRIAQDLHDEVGARLRSGLEKTDLPQTRAVVREAIADMRLVIGGLTGERRPLDHVLADIRHETLARLSGADVILSWPLGGEEAEVDLDYALQKALREALRGVVAEALRAPPSQISVIISRTAKTLHLRVTAPDSALALDRSFDLAGAWPPASP